MRPGRRLKLIRLLCGLSVNEMIKILEFEKKTRYENVETTHVKMNEDDFYKINKNLPEIIFFIIDGQPLSRSALENSKTVLKSIPSRIDAGLSPEGFDISMIDN